MRLKGPSGGLFSQLGVWPFVAILADVARGLRNRQEMSRLWFLNLIMMASCLHSTLPNTIPSLSYVLLQTPWLQPVERSQPSSLTSANSTGMRRRSPVCAVALCDTAQRAASTAQPAQGPEAGLSVCEDWRRGQDFFLSPPIQSILLRPGRPGAHGSLSTRHCHVPEGLAPHCHHL